MEMLRYVIIAVMIIFLLGLVLPMNFFFITGLFEYSQLGLLCNIMVFEAPTHEPQEELKVISCGMPRTASGSIKLGLDQLGYTTYHGGDNWQEGHSKIWLEAFKDPKKLDDVIDMMLSLGYNATASDWPQVLVSVRDSADSWYRSFSDIFRHLSKYEGDPFPLLSFKDNGWHELSSRLFEANKIKLNPIRMIEDSYFPWVNGKHVDSTNLEYIDETSAKERYLESIEEVKRNIIDEKNMLIYNVKQGWDPLIEFLEIDEKPEGPFPRFNQRFVWKYIQINVEMMLRVWPFLILLDLVIIIKFCLCCHRRSSKKKKKIMKKEKDI